VQASPFFELRLPLRLETDGPPVRELLSVNKEQTRFTISSHAEPRHLLLDPDAEDFRILAPSEIPVTVNSIKGSKQLLVVITEDCHAKDETVKRLLESLGQGDAPVIREDKLDETRRQGHDLILCGVPKQRSLLPPLPAGITVHGAKFSVQEDTVHAPDGLLFLVLQVSNSPGRVVALFHSLSTEAAEKYTSKITHYGKYGSLVFTGGAIRYKGTMPPSAGSISVDFSQ
jgi:hypothetical protein